MGKKRKQQKSKKHVWWSGSREHGALALKYWATNLVNCGLQQQQQEPEPSWETTAPDSHPSALGIWFLKVPILFIEKQWEKGIIKKRYADKFSNVHEVPSAVRLPGRGWSPCEHWSCQWQRTYGPTTSMLSGHGRGTGCSSHRTAYPATIRVKYCYFEISCWMLDTLGTAESLSTLS